MVFFFCSRDLLYMIVNGVDSQFGSESYQRSNGESLLILELMNNSNGGAMRFRWPGHVADGMGWGLIESQAGNTWDEVVIIAEVFSFLVLFCSQLALCCGVFYYFLYSYFLIPYIVQYGLVFMSIRYYIVCHY